MVALALASASVILLTMQSHPSRNVIMVTADGIGLSFPGMLLMRVIMQILRD